MGWISDWTERIAQNVALPFKTTIFISFTEETQIVSQNLKGQRRGKPIRSKIIDNSLKIILPTATTNYLLQCYLSHKTTIIAQLFLQATWLKLKRKTLLPSTGSFLQQSRVIFLQSPGHLSSVSQWCFLQSHSRRQTNIQSSLKMNISLRFRW